MIGLGNLARSEARLVFRDPGVAWVIVLPLLLVVIFGVIPSTSTPSPDFGGGRFIDFYVPVLVTMIIGLMSLNLLASVLGTYRERGVLRRLAVTPVKPGTLLLAQGIVNMVLLTTIAVVMLAIAGLAFHVPMPRDVLGFVLAFLLCVAAMFSIGLLIAAVAPTGKAANGIGTVLFFPMAFLSGLWTPGPMMSDTIRRIADFSPLGAGAQAMQRAWDGSFPQPLHLVVLAAYTVIIGFIAARRFRWE
jgi:ABC-2 type transport system permease protein